MDNTSVSRFMDIIIWYQSEISSSRHVVRGQTKRKLVGALLGWMTTLECAYLYAKGLYCDAQYRTCQSGQYLNELISLIINCMDMLLSFSNIRVAHCFIETNLITNWVARTHRRNSYLLNGFVLLPSSLGSFIYRSPSFGLYHG